MKINEFKLERYFAKHEFSAKYLLSSSDCDGYAMSDILAVATDKEKALWSDLKLGYTEGLGSLFLRESILKFYQNVSIENILVASPGELNFISMNVLLNASDHVITISPSYQSLHEVVRSLGCELSFWQPNPANWQFDPADLKKLVRKNTKLIIINFPHNPTGSYLSKTELDQVITIARENDCYLFSDEMYHKLMIGEKEELAPVSNLYEKGISLWGTSKSLGMAGLRTGWLVSQDSELIRKMMSFKDYLSMCTSAPTEVLTSIALNHLDRFLGPNIEKIRRNIQLFKGFVRHYSNTFSFIEPQAGSTAFVKMNGIKSARVFCDQLVAETGIMAVPGEMFAYEETYLRIGFGRENLQEILPLLSSYLNSRAFRESIK